MTLPSRHDAFVQSISGARVQESALLSSQAEPGQVWLSPRYLQTPQGSWRHAKRISALLLKWAARGIYLSPAFILMKLGPEVLNTVAIVGFVGLVVTFFTLLNVYLLVALVEYRVRRRTQKGKLVLPFDEDGNDELDLFPGEPDTGPASKERYRKAGRGGMVRLRGLAYRLGPKAAAETGLVTDFWCTRSNWRVTRFVPFCIRAEGQLPIIVCASSAPILVAPAERRPAPRVGELSDAVGAIIEQQVGSVEMEEEGWQVGLNDGDPVEVMGVVASQVPDAGRFELEGRWYSADEGDDDAGSPYRQEPSGPGLLMQSSADAPVLLRRLSK